MSALADEPRYSALSGVLDQPDVESDVDELILNPPSERKLGPRGTVDQRFVYWYPTWETWKFRRTLSYWIAILYLEGSLLFVIGAAFSMSSLVDNREGNELALVAAPYLVGGVAFSLGAYTGILHVINVPNKDSNRMDLFFFACGARAQWRELRRYLSWEPLVGYVSYFVGALAFNVNTVVGALPDVELSPLAEFLLVWAPAIFGSLAFTLGGLLECAHNRVWRCDVASSAFWLSTFNALGAVLFLVAGLAGAAGATGAAEQWAVNFTYLVGSLLFMAGSLVALWMWKGEHYGLGLVSELNISRDESAAAKRDGGGGGDDEPDPEQFVLSMQAQYGCGRSSAYQLPWLWLYLFNAAASVLDTALAFEQDNARDVHRVVASVLNFFLSHGILMLGSVLHHIPTAAPHNYLLMYMRAILLVYTINAWYGVYSEITTGWHSHDD